MSDVAIRAQNLSKQYEIGLLNYRHNTLRDHLAHHLQALYRRNGHRSNPGRATTWALKDVSVEIEQGDIVGIIGRNGAGKSTLLKVLCRITEPTGGRAEIYGRIGSLLEVGTGFHFELTGRENIYLSGAILGMKKEEIDRKFDEIVEFSEVEKFIDTPVKHYSSGMYVRLAFAVAAHLDPDILVIDEVLSVGDLAFQRKCAERMASMRERSATVVVVSHNMFAIKTMCNHVLYLDRGRVQAYGPPADVIPQYEKDILHQEAMPFDTPRWARDSIGTDPSQRPIYVTEMEVLDESGQRRTIFDYGERMRVRVTFDARETIDHPNFVLAFIRSDNVNCCDYSTALDQFALPSLLSGTGQIEVLTPPLKLISDLYTIQAIVWDTKFQRLYCAQIGKTFHVRHHLLSTSFGVFHESADWSWLPDPHRGQ
jgi:lipopolysaccharide transport system ATP-binding protein